MTEAPCCERTLIFEGVVFVDVYSTHVKEFEAVIAKLNAVSEMREIVERLVKVLDIPGAVVMPRCALHEDARAALAKAEGRT